MALKIANPSITRVENSFKQLASAAQALNSASDDLGKVIRHLDASLKKLALGITAWVQVNGTSDETQYWTSELGYAKVDGKWGIALREVTGYLPENVDETEEIWPFGDAPRALRTEAVGKIPDLLDKMLQLTEEATQNLKEKTEQAAEVAFLVSNLVPNTPPPAPQHWNRPATSATTAEAAGQPGNGSPAGKHTASEAPNGRFREGEQGSAERHATPARSLPAERV
jgi:hypothetical protein